jgi:hemolysin III
MIETAAPPLPTKPLLRGVSHQIAFFAALAGASALLLAARSPQALRGAAIYGASLATLFGVSALYHRRNWRPVARKWMRRLDHSAIFVLIAGTFTPFCLLLGPGARLALALTWGAAALGVLQSCFWVGAPKPLVALLAVAMGWSVLPIVPHIRAATGPSGISLLFSGGVSYCLGAAAYSFKRPDPAPAVFGYHEVFHAFVIAGALCHFAVVASVVRALG